MKHRILVVDDEENVRFAFKTFLQNADCEVALAEDYDTALKLFASDRIDLVVSDIAMGQRTGIELLDAIKKAAFRCPVVIITGEPTLETATAALRLGAFDYLIKPVTKDMLQEIVNRALRQKAVNDERDRSAENLRTIFASVQDGVVSVDDKMVVMQGNKGLEKFFPFSLDKILGKKICDIASPCFDFCIDIIEKTIHTGIPVREFHTEVEGPWVGKMLISVNCSQLISSDSSCIGAVLVLRDISYLIETEPKQKKRGSFCKMIGVSSKMQDIYTCIEALAETDTTVLITGESGTGKELVAQAIHYSSSRATNLLVTCNCSALAESLLESELFGHVAGAFTGAMRDKIGRFEMAHGGTVFLDEIGDLAPHLQLKLLRILQEKEIERVGGTTTIKVDIRIIAATNCDLSKKIQQGTFRKDLYYRLKVMEIHVPPLKERLEDIPLLVRHFCTTFHEKFKKDVREVSNQVMKLFLDYAWPGNVRELEHVLERAFILCNTNIITTQDIALPTQKPISSNNERGKLSGSENSELIQDALKVAQWNMTKAARDLGISRSTFYRWRKANKLPDST